mmetsp:Transcript_32677/g.48386  ORF Transcript_32677/g.48386 Transcript_32677/m.48386 type:complete len:499 (+) Transcript_32677:121-1617(+)|eukprot:CAMPEP_0194216080 /NCGR_PEP_ID=MMETSP0156-20130528/18257_1 /TAXON_ID=33649 /ORGANISM="Thalassionema nitzschioides, Strain L26-B" /LENGTH=498 /DNA_ID=CAMNT_0038944757 /DNA_START=33 /DNA_END=1529 /DNA_ORIENTATION=-
MDFEFAEQRLKREQSKLRSRQRPTISAKAQREAEYRRKQQAEMKRKREEEAAQRHYVLNYYNNCNRALKVRSLEDGDGLCLRATSIHGDGDKIALPPSVLERLTTTQEEGGSSPWTFRIGIINPQYKFPASPALQTMKPADEDDNYGSDEDDDDNIARTAFLEELSCEYIAYAHGTVVEFTQEEGHIGLPSSIAAALLDPKRRSPVTNFAPVRATRTRDPAMVEETDKEEFNGSMDKNDGFSEKTPGHLAYGAFDVPDVPLKVEMITLPKGEACTLVPSMDAIRNGFFNLQNVKLVMEQSLVRTRATLSIGDTVSTWHRGKEFTLTVKSVVPADFGAVSCINTDMEVDFGVNAEYEAEQRLQQEAETDKYDKSRGQPLGGAGRTLSDSPTPMKTERSEKIHPAKETMKILRPEPPIDQKENICTVQIRGDKGSGRRRFDVQWSNIDDLFAFAMTLTSAVDFNLVTRLPRRIISRDEANKILADVLVEGSQEALMIEKL